MKSKISIPAVGALLICLGFLEATLLSQDTKTPATKKAEAVKKPEATKPQAATKKKDAPKPPEETTKPGNKTEAQPAASADPELDVLRENSDAFAKAFNAGDAKGIAALFSEKAEAVDEDGNVLEGRENIEERFAGVFKLHPQAKIVVEIDVLRKLGPDVAVEDGHSTVTLDAVTPPATSPYTVVHVKRDGKWLFASVRDFPSETAPTAHDHLMQLEWLVGKWVDQSRSGRVETTCQWSDDGNYLIQHYVVKTNRGRVLQGTQRIAWDPLKKTIRGWVFDDAGGMMESNWTPILDTWLINSEGTTPEGDRVSVTRLITPLPNGSYQIDSSNQVVGGEPLPDTSVRVVRQPPTPTE